MKFWEAMKALAEGQKVRCVEWPFSEYVDQYGSSYSDMSRLAGMSNDEWALHDPAPEVDFYSVLQGIKEDKIYRRKAWTGGVYLNITPNNRVSQQNDSYRTLTPEDYEACDWIEVL